VIAIQTESDADLESKLQQIGDLINSVQQERLNCKSRMTKINLEEDQAVWPAQQKCSDFHHVVKKTVLDRCKFQNLISQSILHFFLLTQLSISL
jgi:hypothetical protein